MAFGVRLPAAHQLRSHSPQDSLSDLEPRQVGVYRRIQRQLVAFGELEGGDCDKRVW